MLEWGFDGGEMSQRWTQLQLSHGRGFPILTPAGTEGKAQTQPRCEENKVKAEFNTAHEDTCSEFFTGSRGKRFLLQAPGPAQHSQGSSLLGTG